MLQMVFENFMVGQFHSLVDWQSSVAAFWRPLSRYFCFLR